MNIRAVEKLLLPQCFTESGREHNTGRRSFKNSLLGISVEGMSVVRRLRIGSSATGASWWRLKPKLHAAGQADGSAMIGVLLRGHRQVVGIGHCLVKAKHVEIAVKQHMPAIGQGHRHV